MKKFFFRLLGTFWTHCPRCHRGFSGYHEHHHQVKIEGKHYRYVCKHCAKIADIDSKKNES